jgi:hypothetical protein
MHANFLFAGISVNSRLTVWLRQIAALRNLQNIFLKTIEMKSEAVDYQTMAQYLLGELSEEEQMRLEELYFGDKNLFEQLLEVEDELIHKYVKQELSPRERRQFERHFLSRPKQREKVKVAEALMIYLAREQSPREPKAAKTPTSPASIWRAVEARLFSKTPALKWSFAAMVVVILAGLWWQHQNIKRLHTQLTQLGEERLTFRQREQDLQRQIETQRWQSDELAERLRHEQNQRVELEKKLRQQSLPQSNLLTIALMPGASRSAQDMNQFQRSEIRRGAQWVKLQLALESQEAYESYRAILETAKGDTIWSQYQLESQPIEKGRAVILLLPANIFSYDDYLITLYGVSPGREIEYVNGYVLHVTKE